MQSSVNALAASWLPEPQVTGFQMAEVQEARSQAAGFQVAHSQAAGFQAAGPPFRTSSARRRSAERLGRAAEDLVAAGWEKRGFSVLARRLRTGAGEIDLIVADSDSVIFVEVKARRSMAEAAYALSARQQARLLEAAGEALAMNADWQRGATRFDVALVSGGRVELIEDAIRYH